MNATTSGVTRINRSEARTLALAEFDRFADLTASLTPDEWATDTDCVGWDVRALGAPRGNGRNRIQAFVASIDGVGLKRVREAFAITAPLTRFVPADLARAA